MDIQEETPLLPKQTKPTKLYAIFAGLWSCGVLCIFLFFVTVFLVTASLIFDVAFLSNRFSGSCANWNPSFFTVPSRCINVTALNLKQWFVPRANWSDVWFMSRDPWWYNHEKKGRLHGYLLWNSPSSPSIIVSHGYRGCKENGEALLSSAMLWRHGYNVLLVDLRNHGKSDHYEFQPPYVTFGSEEHKDLLGGFDYLKNITTGDIGMVGYSMGGATVLVAGWKESRIKAIFTDSPACMVLETLRSNVDRYYLNGAMMFAWGCVLSGVKSRYGCAPFENDAFEAVKNLKQPVHFEHTRGDHIVPEWNTDICAKTLRDRNVSATVYFQPTNCTNQHTKNIIHDIHGFEKRMIAFFGRYMIKN